MQQSTNHLTIIVGASAVAEDLRQALVRHGVAHAGVATHLRGLRRSMVMGNEDLVIVCIAMDQSTLSRHGDALRHLLADHHCFRRSIRSVGLLTEVGLTPDAAAMGCDVYVHDSRQAAEALALLARRWQAQKTGAVDAAVSVKASSADRVSWVWGMAQAPPSFSPAVLAADREPAALKLQGSDWDCEPMCADRASRGQLEGDHSRAE